jgi:ABC-type amino acid transport substrate-binding protein/predicted Ser/Thr protein kinase
MSQLIGKTLGQYEIIESIGSGGTAQIYRAIKRASRREVVIKVLSPTFREDPSFVKNFAQEVDVIVQLQHPHIIPVYDFGEQDGDVYIVMAFMRGGTLADRVKKSEGGLPDEETIRIFELIADGLDYAHAREIIHRDLKPSNILMDEDHNPYLADFGLAKFTEGKIEMTNTMMTGTAAYMAPEIARQGKSTKRTDIYALGVILFEMLTGKLPYDGSTPYNVLAAHVNKPIPNILDYRPDLPPSIGAVINKALAKEPEDRYASAREMADAFKDVMYNAWPASALEFKVQPATTTSPRPRWFAPILIAILTAVGIFIAATRLNTKEAAGAVQDPTEHVAKAVTTSSGNTQWTFGCLGESTTALVDLACQEINVAVENHFLPYNYIFLATNQPGGMDYDMWWEICTRLHCQPVFTEEKWEDTLSRIAASEYDAASEGITITDERKQFLDFSISYLNIEQHLVVRKGETRFSNINEFLANEDLTIGVQADTTNFQLISQYVPAGRIKTYKEFSLVFYALTTGEIDAAIADQVEGNETVTGIDFQQAVNLEFIGNSLSSDQFGIVLQKDSELLEPINKALQDMRASGALEAIIDRYFGSGFNITYNDIGLGAYGQ